MNERRLKKIKSIRNGIADLKEKLECVLDEEQEAYDNYPESLQGTDRYERMESSIEYMESSIESLDESINYLDDIE